MTKEKTLTLKEAIAKQKEQKKLNMVVWHDVEMTNPKDVKEVSFGRKFTAIDPMSQIMKATEVYGPLGIGWGWEDEEYKLQNFDPTEKITGWMLFYTAMFWFIDPISGTKGYFPLSSSMLLTSSKGKIDEDVYKKIQTDAITKGLSREGFNADVFLGMYDDNKYIAQARIEMEAKEKAKREERLKDTATPADLAKKKAKDSLMKFMKIVKEAGITGGANIKAFAVAFGIDSTKTETVTKALKIDGQLALEAKFYLQCVKFGVDVKAFISTMKINPIQMASIVDDETAFKELVDKFTAIPKSEA